MILRSSPALPFVRAWAHHLKTIVAQATGDQCCPSNRRERHNAKEKTALVFIHSAAQQ